MRSCGRDGGTHSELRRAARREDSAGGAGGTGRAGRRGTVRGRGRDEREGGRGACLGRAGLRSETRKILGDGEDGGVVGGAAGTAAHESNRAQHRGGVEETEDKRPARGTRREVAANGFRVRAAEVGEAASEGRCEAVRSGGSEVDGDAQIAVEHGSTSEWHAPRHVWPRAAGVRRRGGTIVAGGSRGEVCRGGVRRPSGGGRRAGGGLRFGMGSRISAGLRAAAAAAAKEGEGTDSSRRRGRGGKQGRSGGRGLGGGLEGEDGLAGRTRGARRNVIGADADPRVPGEAVLVDQDERVAVVQGPARGGRRPGRRRRGAGRRGGAGLSHSKQGRLIERLIRLTCARARRQEQTRRQEVKKAVNRSRVNSLGKATPTNPVEGRR